MDTQPIIYWFRQDLRLADLPGLVEAASNGIPVVPVYVLDDAAPGEWAPGAASRWWLHHSLKSLAASIRQQHGSLWFHTGSAAQRLIESAAQTGARGIYCSRAFDPWAVQQEHDVRHRATRAGLAFERFAGSLLFEPEQIRTQSGTFYQTFTPFWKALVQPCRGSASIRRGATCVGGCRNWPHLRTATCTHPPRRRKRYSRRQGCAWVQPTPSPS